MIFNITTMVHRWVIDVERITDQPKDRPFFKDREDYFILTNEIHEWLSSYHINYALYFNFNTRDKNYGWNIAIPKKSDAVLFKLTWK